MADKPEDVTEDSGERELNDVEKRREAEAEEEDALKDLPALLPALSFRQRQRSDLMKMFLKYQDLVGSTDTDEGLSSEDASDVLDVLADADEFFEAIAVDKDAYRQWASGGLETTRKIEHLLGRYMRQLGE